jgi:glycosyltransferase involved in cell wall biosynthesis
VCTRSRPVLLRRALAALVADLDERGEIIVVDNAPTDGATAAVAREFPVRYLVEPELGLNRARRLGLEHASGDVVLFTDDDAIVEPGWASALCEPFADSRVGAATGITLPLTLETPAQEMRERYFSFHRGFDRREYDFTTLPPAAAGATGVGVNMALRREVAKRLALFTPSLDCGTPSRSGGDTYALYRVLAEGWRVVYTPEAIAAHDHGATVEQLARTAEGYSTGVFVVFLRALLRHRDLQAVRVAASWLAHHHARELARALLRRRNALPLSVVLAEWRGVARAPGAYLATTWS